MKRSTILLIAACLALVPMRFAEAACLVDSDCSDGNLCTGTEKCVNGACQHGPSLNCNDQNPCMVDDCDPSVGCIHATVADGTSCDDGVFCNGAETCQGGICGANPYPNGTPCDDDNRCTTGDACQAGACVGTPRADGAQCSDGNLCNGLELCFSGVCTSGQPKSDGTSCSDGNPCNGTESCRSGTCVPGTPLPEGALCSDGSVCNGTETCKQGLCVAGIPPNGTSCSDGNLCNGSETCQNQVCTSSAPLNCNDNNPCTSDSCNPTLGCQHPNKSDGTSCPDQNPCNGVERCQSGQCMPGTPEADGVSCSDGNPCNGFESCEGGACTPGTPPPEGVSCDDGNYCNGRETCHNRECTSDGPRNCYDGNPCTADSCDPVLGCRNPPLPDGSSCDDDDVCNGVSVCQRGQCTAGTPLVCTDTDPVTINGCDPRRGCTRDRLLAGAVLNVHYTGFGRWTIHATAGETFVIGRSIVANGSDADPVIHGASLRIVSHAGGEDFDARFDLPAAGWSYTGAPGDNAGYRYRDRSPGATMRAVKMRTNRPWKLKGRGSAIGPHLGVDPRPVSVHLSFNNERYCMSFGGSVAYLPGRQYRALKAPPPEACEP